MAISSILSTLEGERCQCGTPAVDKKLPSQGCNSLDLRILDVEKSSLDDCARVLECFLASHQRRVDQPVSTTLEQYRHAKPGTRALLWLLNTKGTHRSDYMEHPTFLKAVVHCLVAEGALSTLSDWILVRDNPLALLTALPSEERMWRGLVLRGTVQAQAYWSQRPLPLEESMEFYLSTTERAKVERSRVPHALAGTWFSSVFSRSDAPPSVTISQFDCFVSRLSLWMRDKHQIAFERARLMLQHPREGDATAALAFLQHHLDPLRDEYLRELFDPDTKRNSDLGFMFMVQTAQVLARKGRLEDSHWVLDFGRARLPHKFGMGPSTGQAVASRRRKPSAAEIHAGHADKDGNWLNGSIGGKDFREKMRKDASVTPRVVLTKSK